MVHTEGMPASQHSPSDGSVGSPARSEAICEVTSEGYSSGDHSSGGYAPTGERCSRENASRYSSYTSYTTGWHSPAFSDGTNEGTLSEGYASSPQPYPARTSGNTNDSRGSTRGHSSEQLPHHTCTKHFTNQHL